MSTTAVEKKNSIYVTEIYSQLIMTSELVQL